MSNQLIPGSSPGGPAPLPLAAPERPDTYSAAVTLREVIGALRRHWPLILLAVLVGAAAATVYVRRKPPQFRATAVIRLIDRSQAMSGGLAAAPMPIARGGADPLLSQLQVLQSRTTAEAVVRNSGFRLRHASNGEPVAWAEVVSAFTDPAASSIQLAFEPDRVTVTTGNSAARGAYGDSIVLPGMVLRIRRPRSSIDSVTLRVIPLDEAVTEFQAAMQARPRERTDVVDVTFTTTDPVVAQRVANATIQVFQQQSTAAARQASVRRRQFIGQQLAKVELLHSEAQLAYNGFRSRARVFSSQDRFRTQQADLTSLEIRRQDLDGERRTYAALLDSLASAARGGNSAARLVALMGSPGIAGNPVVSQLYSRLSQLQSSRDSLLAGPSPVAVSNPDLRRIESLIQSTESNIVAAARGQISAIDARIAALNELAQRSSQVIAGLPAAEAAEAQLLAQVSLHQREAERLREELQKAEIAEAAEGGQVEVLDLAGVPATPLNDRTAPIVALGALMGLVIALGLGYLRDNFRPVIREASDLEQVVPVPILAYIPKIVPRRISAPARDLEPGRRSSAPQLSAATGTDLVVFADTRSLGAEAYRTLRTNLLFSAAVKSMQRVVVTSAGPGEGKSTTASNVAVAFAQQGHRVALVDCDLRRPRLSEVFGIPREPGLTNVLIGGAASGAALHRTKVEMLTVVPSGTIPPNPAELLGSAGMEQFLSELQRDFDLVVIDTPPLLVASDASIVGRGADGVILVVRAGRTDRTSVQMAAQQLGSVGARIIGTVLNDPDSEAVRFSGYYRNYHAAYEEYSRV